MTPERRDEMRAVSEVLTIPQLHVNGQVRISCSCSAVYAETLLLYTT